MPVQTSSVVGAEKVRLARVPRHGSQRDPEDAVLDDLDRVLELGLGHGGGSAGATTRWGGVAGPSLRANTPGECRAVTRRKNDASIFLLQVSAKIVLVKVTPEKRFRGTGFSAS